MMPCRWNPGPGLVNRCRRLHPSSAPGGTPLPCSASSEHPPAAAVQHHTPPPPLSFQSPKSWWKEGSKRRFFPGPNAVTACSVGGLDRSCSRSAACGGFHPSRLCVHRQRQLLQRDPQRGRERAGGGKTCCRYFHTRTSHEHVSCFSSITRGKYHPRGIIIS